MLKVVTKTLDILSSFDNESRSSLLKLALIVLLTSLVEVASIGVLLPYLNMVTEGKDSNVYIDFNLLYLDYDAFMI
jgi:hypothetical protein